ncbi:uncharacterized protein [Coffea arabica]|uniref:Ty3 transposon capsid-like protein domain-containing protein n=1 Tax=Coffea arabica TaxID=13443 RepID=A0A6P6SB63_COFAR|nr:uncharacterized protein LOC113689094 [Coffea arabica]
MEGLLTGMEQNFRRILEQKLSNFLIRMTPSKEKATEGEEGVRTVQTPLLPTPPAHHRLQVEGEAQRLLKKDWSKFQIPNPPKIDLQLFSGEHPRDWLRKCNKYFLNYQVPNEHKIEITEMYLEGKADKWFQGVKIERPRLGWEEFEDLLCRRFNDQTCKDIVEEFNKLQQVGTIDDYQERFEELKPLMMIKNRNLDENYFISSFISGLKEEIKLVVRMLKPTTLSEAFELSQWSSPGDTREPTKLSAQELQYRRSNGLCFRCGEKYGMGQQCKVGHSNCMTLEEEEDSAFEDALGEQDEQTRNPGQAMEMSLHALSEALKRKTITLSGILDGEEVLILVDTGSSDSYISSELVIGMDISYQWVDQPFSVIMGNGSCVTSNAICNGVQWRINQHNFRYNLKLKISLHHEGDEIYLHGQADNCDMDLIRGKDLRTFIEYKRQMCMAISSQQDKDREGESEPTPQEVETLLQDYKDVFQTPSSLPPSRSVDHEIPLKQEAQPFKLKPYRYPHCHKEEIEKQVAEMLQKGIVKHSNSPFASPVLLVKKKEGTWRFCVDYRKLNEITIKDRFPIPNVDELLDELSGAVFKTKLDLTAGYHQIRVKP